MGTEEMLHESREEELFPLPSKDQVQQMVNRVMVAPTQASVKEASDMIIDLVKEGVIDPLQLVVKLKGLTEVFENVRKNVTDDVLQELSKYTKDELATSLGAKLEKMEGGVKYDYSVCNDPAWQTYNQKMESAKASMGEREAFLKALKHPMAIADESTGGEMVTVNPPIRKSTSTFKIILSK